MLNQAGDLYAGVSRIGDNSIAAGHCTASTFYQMGAYPVAEFIGVVNASYLYDNTNPLTGERAGTGETWFRTTLGSLQLVTTAVGVRTALPVKFRPAALLAPNRPAAFFDDLAVAGTRNADSTRLVLGKWSATGQSYQNVAAHIKATYFKLANWRELSKLLTQDELWKINEAFLRQQLKLGKQVILSHDPATATGFFAREVKYLRSLGYRFVQDGWVWKAVR